MDVTLELNEAFQSDPNLYTCLKELPKDQKVTTHRFQQLLKFLKNKSYDEKQDHLKGGLIKACENLQKDYKMRTQKVTEDHISSYVQDELSKGKQSLNQAYTSLTSIAQKFHAKKDGCFNVDPL